MINENVYIADINIGEFKELNFETARFSDGENAIRGFGYTLNDRNLNIIDTFEITFVVDYPELENLLYVYHSFKAFGALPLKNEYIMKKIKTSLFSKTLVSEFNKTELSSNDDIIKEISALLVFLERMSIRSLEQADKGFSVSMVLTLHREALSMSEEEYFNQKFQEFSTTEFGSIVKSGIKNNIKALIDDGSFSISIANIERINVLYNYDVLLNTKNITTEENNTFVLADNQYSTELNDTIEKNEKRYNSARLKNMGTYDKILIPAENIGQIELITYNDISNSPIVGNNIGVKSFLGIGQTTFSIKMVFGETQEDEVLIAALKKLSDKNIISHKFDFENPLIGMFDFHSGVITHIHFDNAEQLDGIIVTLKVILNGNDFFRPDIEESINTEANIGKIVYRTESIVENNDLFYYNFLENLFQNMVKNSNENLDFTPESFLNFCNSPIDGKMFSLTAFKQGQSTTSDAENAGVNLITLCDVLSSYSTVGVVPRYHKTIGANTSALGAASTRTFFYEAEEDKSCLFRTNVKDSVNSQKNKANYKTLFIKNINTVSTVDILDLINRISNTNKNDEEFLFSNRDFASTTSINTLKMFDAFGLLGSYVPNNKDYIEFIEQSMNKDLTEEFLNKCIKPSMLELINVDLNTKTGYFTDEEIVIVSKIHEYYLVGLFNIIADKKIIQLITSLNDDTLDKNNTAYFDLNRFRIFSKQITERIIELFIATLKNENIITGVATYMSEVYKREKNISADIYRTYEYYYSLTSKIVTKLETDLIQTNILSETTYDECFYIGLTKTIYAYILEMSARMNDKQQNYYIHFEKNNLTQILISNLISSSLMSPFLFQSKYKTSLLGYKFRATKNICGNYLSFYANSKFVNDLYQIKQKNIQEENEFDIEDLRAKCTKETNYWLYGVHSDFLTNDINYNNSTLIEKVEKIDNPIQDYLFFFNHKIKDMKQNELIDEVFKLSNQNKLKANVDFANSIKEQFATDTILTRVQDEWFYNLTDTNVAYNLLQKSATCISGLFKKVSNNFEFYNERFKKRLIGNFDIFDTMNKLVKTVNDEQKQVIPNYRVMVTRGLYKTADKPQYYKKYEENKIILLSGINSVRISKDPKTKVESCHITLISMDKYVLNNSNNEISIGLFYKNSYNNDIQFQGFSVSDDIHVDLGYSSDLKRSFNGTIKEITTAGNFINIVASGFGLALSTESININGGTFFNEKTSENMFSKLISSPKTVILDKSVKDAVCNVHTNKHLFNFEGIEGIPASDKELVEFNKIGESYSMFNMTGIVLNKVSSDGKMHLYSGNLSSKYNGSLVSDKMIKENLKNVFGDTFNSEEAISTNSYSRLFENVYNVDRDYEVYGIYKK